MELWIVFIGFIGLVGVGFAAVVFGEGNNQAGEVVLVNSSVVNTVMPTATRSWFERHGIDSLVLGPDGFMTSV